MSIDINRLLTYYNLVYRVLLHTMENMLNALTCKPYTTHYYHILLLFNIILAHKYIMYSSVATFNPGLTCMFMPPRIQLCTNKNNMRF